MALIHSWLPDATQPPAPVDLEALRALLWDEYAYLPYLCTKVDDALDELAFLRQHVEALETADMERQIEASKQAGEWPVPFKAGVTLCWHCGLQIEDGQHYRHLPNGYAHFTCCLAHDDSTGDDVRFVPTPKGEWD